MKPRAPPGSSAAPGKAAPASGAASSAAAAARRFAPTNVVRGGIRPATVPRAVQRPAAASSTAATKAVPSNVTVTRVPVAQSSAPAPSQPRAASPATPASTPTAGVATFEELEDEYDPAAPNDVDAILAERDAADEARRRQWQLDRDLRDLEDQRRRLREEREREFEALRADAGRGGGAGRGAGRGRGATLPAWMTKGAATAGGAPGDAPGDAPGVARSTVLNLTNVASRGDAEELRRRCEAVGSVVAFDVAQTGATLRAVAKFESAEACRRARDELAGRVVGGSTVAASLQAADR